MFNSKKTAIQFKHRERLQKNEGEPKAMKMLQLATRNMLIKIIVILLSMCSNNWHFQKVVTVNHKHTGNRIKILGPKVGVETDILA